jgi:hypothetical protein
MLVEKPEGNIIAGCLGIVYRIILKLNNTAFWDMMICNLVEVYQRFGGTCCLNLQGRTEA